MSKHTKGPWVWDEESGYIIGAEPVGARKNCEVAAVCAAPIYGVDSANGCLIAAAPELLEALRPFANLDTNTPSELWKIRAEL